MRDAIEALRDQGWGITYYPKEGYVCTSPDGSMVFHTLTALEAVQRIVLESYAKEIKE